MPNRDNRDSGFADRLTAMEKLFADMANTVDAIVDAYNNLDVQHEHLHYKLQFVMDSVIVERKNPRAILDANGKGESVVRGSLTQFFAADGEKYIAVLKAQADALQKKLQAHALGAANINDAIRDTIREQRAAGAADSAEGSGEGEAAPGPRLVTSQA